MNWEDVGLGISVVFGTVAVFFVAMSIYTLGKIHGLKEAAKHFGNELRW